MDLNSQTMSTSEKFCLKWNDSQENISSIFGSLREDTDFTDVTLACEDGQQVEAHKVILAALSPIFHNLLKRNKHAHPLIYMRGMKSEDLLAIVNFLYYGEANIDQENLDSFLVIAEELQLKGLTGGNHPEETSNPQEIPVKFKLPEVRRSTENFETTPVLKSVDIKVESSTNTTMALQTETVSGRIEQLDEKVKSMWILIKQNGPSTYVCKVCGKEARFNTQIKYHIEANHIEGISLPCNICEKTFRSNKSLMSHKSTHHK